MRNFEITLREVLVSIPVVIISIAVGYFIATAVHDHVTERNSPYFKALKVDNDEEIFNYSLDTRVGDVLSFGTFRADEIITDKNVDGWYSSLIIEEEHYTPHTRTVSYKCGKSTCTRTETYWTWDKVGEEHHKTPTFTYLGNTIDYKSLKGLGSSHKHIDTVDGGFNVRFQYSGLPTEFNGTLFSNSISGELAVKDFFYNSSLQSVIEKKEAEAEESTLIFWVAWILFVLIAVFAFYYAENKWLHK